MEWRHENTAADCRIPRDFFIYFAGIAAILSATAAVGSGAGIVGVALAEGSGTPGGRVINFVGRGCGPRRQKTRHQYKRRCSAALVLVSCLLPARRRREVDARGSAPSRLCVGTARIFIPPGESLSCRTLVDFHLDYFASVRTWLTMSVISSGFSRLPSAGMLPTSVFLPLVIAS